MRKAEPPCQLGKGPRGGGQVLQNLEATREAAVYSEKAGSSNISEDDCCAEGLAGETSSPAVRTQKTGRGAGDGSSAPH